MTHRPESHVYRPPPRPPIVTPVPLRDALADMDRDDTDDHPTRVPVDGSAVAVARLFGWDSPSNHTT